MPPSPATRDYQARQRQLRALTYQDVIVVWPRLDMQRLDDSFPGFAAAVLAVVGVRSVQSVTLAREYWALVRRAAGLRAEMPAVDAAPVDTNLVAASLLSASVVSVKKAMTAGRDLDLARRNALVNTLGVADLAVEERARTLIRAATDVDDEARGWTRAVSGGCDWCNSMAGPVLPASARMAAHPHCGCTPEPVFG